MTGQTIFTIGHSTRNLGDFIGLLEAHSITTVVDVRTVPRSRHNPQFDKETLPESLKTAGIGYVHIEGLGGLRKTSKDSQNAGWRNPSFRGFADYMQTPEFEKALVDAIRIAGGAGRTALMCAEAVPWRCHRSLVADALVVRGINVEHIIGKGPTQRHDITPFAKVDGLEITYPPAKI